MKTNILFKYVIVFLIGFCLFFITKNVFAYEWDGVYYTTSDSKCNVQDGVYVCIPKQLVKNKSNISETAVLHKYLDKLINTVNIVSSENFKKLMEKQDDVVVKMFFEED